MTKVFYISKASKDKTEDGKNIPTTDRFERINKLNRLVSLGWQIKEFKTEGAEEYFLLEKEDGIVS